MIETEEQEHHQNSQSQGSTSPDSVSGQLPIKTPPTFPPAGMDADSEIRENLTVTPEPLGPQLDEAIDHSIVSEDVPQSVQMGGGPLGLRPSSVMLFFLSRLQHFFFYPSAGHFAAEEVYPTQSCLVPLALLMAAGIVYLYPKRGTTVLLLLGALGTFGPTSGPLACFLAEMLQRVSLRIFRSKQLSNAAKEAYHAVISDPRTKQAFVETWRDFMVDDRTLDASRATCTKSLTASMAAALQDPHFQEAFNALLQNAVREAVKGAMGAANPPGNVLREVRLEVKEAIMKQDRAAAAVEAALLKAEAATLSV